MTMLGRLRFLTGAWRHSAAVLCPRQVPAAARQRRSCSASWRRRKGSPSEPRFRPSRSKLIAHSSVSCCDKGASSSPRRNEIRYMS